tara:strand:- start:10082 stop:10249 length:168 start_codon:yes stop_codon:yes gene_type:complete
MIWKPIRALEKHQIRCSFAGAPSNGFFCLGVIVIVFVALAESRQKSNEFTLDLPN